MLQKSFRFRDLAFIRRLKITISTGRVNNQHVWPMAEPALSTNGRVSYWLTLRSRTSLFSFSQSQPRLVLRLGEFKKLDLCRSVLLCSTCTTKAMAARFHHVRFCFLGENLFSNDRHVSSQLV